MFFFMYASFAPDFFYFIKKYGINMEGWHIYVYTQKSASKAIKAQYIILGCGAVPSSIHSHFNSSVHYFFSIC